MLKAPTATIAAINTLYKLRLRILHCLIVFWFLMEKKDEAKTSHSVYKYHLVMFARINADDRAHKVRINCDQVYKSTLV